MFDVLASNYDLMNNIISLGMHKSIKKKAISKVKIKSGMKILDVCCGTGDISLLINQNYGNSVEITGVDFSENMLEISKKRAENFNNISFQKADAMNLPFVDGSFDIVFISFGLRNLTDIKKSIQEFKRVAKTGGYVVNLDFGKPNKLVYLIYRLYFFFIVPILGKLFNKNSEPYEYLPSSCAEFPAQNKLEEIFKESGLKNVKNINYLFGAISQQIAEL